ncbi:MAG TPA: TetR/AcrR family transcriptional regulator [Acidimicrobiales bacterium]|nr:TetR/AcrR family transcriptional regulator [Acidimicrobiales bacterium]
MSTRLKQVLKMAQDTRQRIVEAALATLKQDGYAGTSARAVARTGGFNQALVFYYFGSVNELLLAALDATSDRRMARYQAALAEVQTLPELFRVAGDVYREDLAEGHITVLAELLSAPDLRPEISARIVPWAAFTEAAIVRVLGDSPVAELVPPRDLAYGIVALYLGIELLTHLDGDDSRAESLFAAGTNVASMLGAFLGTA